MEQTLKKRQYNQAYYQANRARVLEHSRQHYRENRLRILEYKSRSRAGLPLEIRQRQRKSARYHNLKHCYGMTQLDFERMLWEQGGRCACCRVALATDIDHDHETGKVRALLCGGCNRGLGQFQDDLARVEMAVEYLKKHVKD